MKYYSLHHQSPPVSFREAVIRGIAPDRGLYYPSEIVALPKEFYREIGQKSNPEIAFQSIRQFTAGDIPDEKLFDIVEDVLQFEFPVIPITEQIASLELYHGPTMAFKDVGARFMARALGYFYSSKNDDITVLVATSGDTGGAVASGFLGVEGVHVVILYPSGKVSEIQEKQLTTLGNNITALEVEGSFDDCQEMVKTAFIDAHITDRMRLTSANSINVARWLPQQFYYLFAYKQLKSLSQELVFSVPSGNFGNLCAGMVAQRMGLPVSHFIAATNINDTVPKYMHSGTYKAQKSFATISNAMDVGDPSNFVRILELFNHDFNALKKQLSSYSFTDDQTRQAIKEIYEGCGYIADPHGAVGYLGLKEYLKEEPEKYGVFLETAHPVKFLDVVEETLGIKADIPPQIEQVLHRKKHAISISSYEDLRSYLLSD